MKMLIVTAAAVLVAGSAFAQASKPNDATMAGSVTGNTGRTDNGAANNNPAMQTPAPATGAMAMASTDTMTVKDGKWWMGDHKATKAEIAQWKKENPTMSAPM